jgi:hypothetical protein
MQIEAEEVACRGCGVATARRVEERVEPGHTNVPRTYRVGTCDDCATLDLDAPGSAVRALLRLAGRDESAWREAAPLLADVDVSAVLRGRAAPQARPWAHVDRDLVRAARRVWAEVLYARVSANNRGRPAPPPRPEPSETGEPCCFCGRTEAVDWTWCSPAPDALGRGSNPGVARRYLCEPCAESATAVGSISLRAAAHAYLAHEGVDFLDPDEVAASRRFSAHLGSGEPGGEPWHWLGGVAFSEPPPTLESLAARVASLEARLA